MSLSMPQTINSSILGRLVNSESSNTWKAAAVV